jgi:hypothetical protein
MKKIAMLLIALCAMRFADSFAAPRKGTAIIATTSKATVRDRVAAEGLYDEACYNAFFGCMDQFCMSDNESGGSCQCSADYAQYDAQMKLIEKNTDEANRISTIEVEKVQAGSKADILFSATGTREYDNDGKVVNEANKSAEKRRARQAEIDRLFNSDADEEEEEESQFSLEGLTGKALYDGAREMCAGQVGKTCGESDLKMITQVYLTQVKNDCAALSKVIKDLVKKSELAVLDAQKAVREARDEAFAKDNEYDRGTCMVEFKKCMKTEDACGSDWNRCVGSVAIENMQNNSAVSTRGTKVSHMEKFAITDSVQEMLSSKRNICEKVLDKCMANRDFVWDDFLRDVAPELKIAEQSAEANKRQSCLSDISSCIQRACRDDIAGKGVETMDSCLARPDMARSFCKIEIDPCERMEPQIWDYVVSKLAAMRVDACTQEVKDCFTSDDRCGSDFSNCIGMDYKFLHDMCPVDKLVVCKQANKNFKMSDIDDMLMGFFLNIDNNALELCQSMIEDKMTEVCGSTTDCDKFAADDTIGTSSLQPQKTGATYKITGMISFGMIKIGDGRTVCDGVEEDGKCKKENILPVGQIGVKDYIAEVRKKNGVLGDNAGIIDSIEANLLDIAGSINRVSEMIESDQKIQYCVEGRDLSQINGGTGRNNRTTARFPNLLNSQKLLITNAALRKANDNYNEKFNKELSAATKKADLDLAQFMCQKMASAGGAGGYGAEPEQSLAPPYSISYEVSSGIAKDGLMSGGSYIDSKSGNASGGGSVNAGIIDIGFSKGGSASSSGGIRREKTAVFSRETRNCHLCTFTAVESCSSSGGTKGFLGIGAKSASSSCNWSEPVEKCEDIAM